MARLTKAQMLLLRQIQAGETLVRHFDVWGGYTLELRPSGKHPHAQTVQALISAGHIEAGEPQRVFSGRQITEFRLRSSVEEE